VLRVFQAVELTVSAEIQLAEFQRRIQRRVGEFSKKVDNIQNELTNSHTELVLTERNCNEELLVQNQKLTSQNEELNKKAPSTHQAAKRRPAL
jgi:hypothetical protein